MPKVAVLESTVDMLPSNITTHLDTKAIDKLFWILFRIRPDTKMCDIGLVEATMRDTVKYMKKARARVIKSYGNNMMGLTDDLSNIDEVAESQGWRDSWWLPKPKPRNSFAKAKAAPPSAPTTAFQLVLDSEGCHRLQKADGSSILSYG